MNIWDNLALFPGATKRLEHICKGIKLVALSTWKNGSIRFATIYGAPCWTNDRIQFLKPKALWKSPLNSRRGQRASSRSSPVSSRTLSALLVSHHLTAGRAAVFCATWINSERLWQSQGRGSKVAIAAVRPNGHLGNSPAHPWHRRGERKSKGSAGMGCCCRGSGTVWLGFYWQDKNLQHCFIGSKRLFDSADGTFTSSSYLPATDVTKHPFLSNLSKVKGLTPLRITCSTLILAPQRSFLLTKLLQAICLINFDLRDALVDDLQRQELNKLISKSSTKEWQTFTLCNPPPARLDLDSARSRWLSSETTQWTFCLQPPT